MRIVLIVIAAVMAIPLLTFFYLYMTGVKVIIVRNEGDARIEISATISSGPYTERTPDKAVAPRGFAWIIFFPRTEGLIALKCSSPDALSRVSLGLALRKAFLFSNIKLDSCRRVVSRSGFAF